MQREDPIALYEGLEKDKYDIIFNFDFNSGNYFNFEKKLIEKIPLIVVLYEGHPLASRNILSREELKKEKFIVNKINYLKNDGSEKILDQYIKSGFIPNIVYESIDIETILIMVSTGMGISILPEYVASIFHKNLNLVYRPLIGEDEFVEIYAFWKKQNRNPALKSFK